MYNTYISLTTQSKVNSDILSITPLPTASRMINNFLLATSLAGLYIKGSIDFIRSLTVHPTHKMEPLMQPPAVVTCTLVASLYLCSAGILTSKDMVLIFCLLHALLGCVRQQLITHCRRCCDPTETVHSTSSISSISVAGIPSLPYGGHEGFRLSSMLRGLYSSGKQNFPEKRGPQFSKVYRSLEKRGLSRS